MDWLQIFQSFLAFIFVLGLLFITLWLIKNAENTGIKLCSRQNSKSRLKLIEKQRLDVKNSLCLISCDKQEYLLLLGDKSNLVINNQNTSKGSSHE